MRIFIERLHESVSLNMRSYWSTHSGVALYDLTPHASLLLALQKGLNVYAEKGSDHRRMSKNRRGRRGNSPSIVTVIKTGCSTPTTTVMPTTNASVAMQIGSSPPSTFTPATTSTSGSSVTYVGSTSFSGCVWRCHIVRHDAHLSRIIFVNDSALKK